jgi:hypothetical protein
MAFIGGWVSQLGGDGTSSPLTAGGNNSELQYNNGGVLDGVTPGNLGDNLVQGAAGPEFAAPIWADDGTAIYPTNLGRNVGIGTDAPTSKLDILDTSWVGGAGNRVVSIKNAAGQAKFWIDQYGWLGLMRWEDASEVYFSVTAPAGIPHLHLSRPNVPNTSVRLSTSIGYSFLPTGLKIGESTAETVGTQEILRVKGATNDSSRYNTRLIDSLNGELLSVRNDGAVFAHVLATSASYKDDTVAAAGGVAIGQLYRDGSTVKIRIA